MKKKTRSCSCRSTASVYEALCWFVNDRGEQWLRPVEHHAVHTLLCRGRSTSSASSEIELICGVLQCKRFGHHETFRVEDPGAAKRAGRRHCLAKSERVLRHDGRVAACISFFCICTSAKDRRSQCWRAMSRRLQLHNDLIDLLMEQWHGFCNGTENTARKRFVRVVSRVLLDVVPEKSLQRFANRSLQLPTWLDSLKGKIYDSPALHNTRSFLYAPAPTCKRWQRISWRSRRYRSCSFHAGMMFPILCCRSLEILKSMPTISQAAPSARTVCTCRDAARQVCRARRLHHTCTPWSKGTDSGCHCSLYKSLEDQLAPAEVYGEPVFVKAVAPTKRHLRYQYIHGLELPFLTELYSYNTGSHAWILRWIWRAPFNASDGLTTLPHSSSTAWSPRSLYIAHVCWDSVDMLGRLYMACYVFFLCFFSPLNLEFALRPWWETKKKINTA